MWNVCGWLGKSVQVNMYVLCEILMKEKFPFAKIEPKYAVVLCAFLSTLLTYYHIDMYEFYHPYVRRALAVVPQVSNGVQCSLKENLSSFYIKEKSLKFGEMPINR